MSKKTTSARRLSESSSNYSDTNVKLASTEERKQHTSHSSKSKKSKPYIAPVNPPSKLSARELFGTDSEDESEKTTHDTKRKAVHDKKRPSSQPHRSSEPERKRSKHQESPPSSAKLSARDVFGTDSDDDGIEDQALAGKKPPILTSYLNKRIASGLARQTFDSKPGSHYVELKVYKCDEIMRIQPMNRWRHAIITIKNKTDDNTDAWDHLTKFIKATRQEFKDCKPEIISTNVLGKDLEIPQVESVFQNLRSQHWAEDEIFCRNKIFDLLENVKNSTLWASWVWDSIQQAPLGTFYGSRYNLGNYDQCLRPPWLTSNPELRMQYCLAEIRMDKVGLKKKDPISPYASSDEYLLERITDFGRIFSDFWYGVCLPAECPTASIDKFVRALMNTTHIRSARDAEVIINHCEVAGAKHEYPPGFYGYIYTFAALLFMAVASTYYLIEYPMTAGPDTFANHVAKSFCLRRNWATVFKEDKDALTSLHGIRFLTCVIIVFIHQMAFLQGNSVSNALDFEAITKKYVPAVPIVHFDLYVDSFFAMAALLLGKTLATLDVSKPKNVLNSILKRYIRLIGPFAVTVLYLVHVSLHTDDGPVYQKTARFEQQACEKNWWLALLMVGNYINTSEMCHPATWYIPCDFHFYVITLILLYLYRKNPSVGRTAAAVVLFVGFVGPAVSTWVYDLPAVITYNLGSDINIRLSKSFIHGYIRTHNRMGPYVMGLIVGYLMSVYKPADYKKIWSKTVSFLGAMVSLGIMGVVLVTGLLCYHYGVEGILACLFMTFNRTVFAISVLGIIVFCTYGDVPLINSLLSWPVFAPVSRLSYGVYVIHLLILYRSKISLRSSAKFHCFESLIECFGLVMISLMLSLTVWLLVEAPLINFSNRYLSTKSASKDIVGNANGSLNNTKKIK